MENSWEKHEGEIQGSANSRHFPSEICLTDFIK